MPGDRVLSLLPIPGKPLQARYYGPYTVDKKLSDVNYIVEIFSTVILSLPLIQEEQLSVSGERMCTILVNRLED